MREETMSDLPAFLRTLSPTAASSLFSERRPREYQTETNPQPPEWQPLPPQTESVVTGIRVVSMIYLIVSVSFFLWDLYTALPAEDSWLRRRNANSSAWRLFVMRTLTFAQNSINIALFLMVVIQVYWIPYAPGVYSCTLLTRFSTLSYAASVQLVLFTLVVRCGFVEGLIKTKTYRFISFSSKIALGVFVPMVFSSTVYFFVDGHLTSSGLCLLVNTAPDVFLYLFLAGVGVMTVVMMYLFVAPIQMSIAAINPSNTERLKHTLYRNVMLNSIAMAVQITCSALFWHLNTGRQQSDWDNGAHLTLSLIFPCTDCLLIGICARLMVGEATATSRRSQQVLQDPSANNEMNLQTLPTPETVHATNSLTLAMG